MGRNTRGVNPQCQVATHTGSLYPGTVDPGKPVEVIEHRPGTPEAAFLTGHGDDALASDRCQAGEIFTRSVIGMNVCVDKFHLHHEQAGWYAHISILVKGPLTPVRGWHSLFA